jgi:hypothetical protein
MSFIAAADHHFRQVDGRKGFIAFISASWAVEVIFPSLYQVPACKNGWPLNISLSVAIVIRELVTKAYLCLRACRGSCQVDEFASQADQIRSN